MVKKSVWLFPNLTTERAGVGENPVVTASIPRTDRVPVAYIRVKFQLSSIRASRLGVSGRPPNPPT